MRTKTIQNASTDASEQPDRLLRIHEIIGDGGLIPVSRSTWWQGVRDGRFPKPIKFGSKISLWRQADIRALMDAGSE